MEQKVVFFISFSESKLSKTSSLLILLVGIVAIALAVFSVAQPIFVAILIGLCLIIEGVKLYLFEDKNE